MATTQVPDPVHGVLTLAEIKAEIAQVREGVRELAGRIEGIVDSLTSPRRPSSR